MVRVFLCSSAWKGSLSPGAANSLIREALATHRPDWQVTDLPLSDGGDGWLEMLAAVPALPGETLGVSVTGPLPEFSQVASYRWIPDALMLGLESAAIHGMRCLPKGQLAPLAATSYGVGEALKTLMERHPEARRVVVSVGGSASIDAGVGAMQAMGWRFLDEAGVPIEEPIGGGHLARVAQVRPPEAARPRQTLTVLVDVMTPFVAAPAVFGPQKGATPEEVAVLTAQFHRLLSLLPGAEALAGQPGTGAAGGLPLGLLLAWPGARIESGMAWAAKTLGLEAAVVDADLVITGEGCLDDTSLLGKGTGYVVETCARLGKPLVILCGQCRLPADLPGNPLVVPLVPDDRAATPRDWWMTPTTLPPALSAALSAIEQRLASPLA